MSIAPDGKSIVSRGADHTVRRWEAATGKEQGQFRLTVRVTRYNSQNYPLVTATLQDEIFKTATAARAFAREVFGAEPGQSHSRP